ncbi:hypothetical protein KTR66_24025 [Roseococcus sp. SDR]|uniref:hypothetical protein n=1 Tax=Roseococcus sp. SDR TaxID=2835532 RepID=UPI001BCD934C|nr:hypothetical protein [Roseococcus sp. SDR]MBS7793071.1 hypothetical protein [Roseococcus sp. SDR]MBV1848385.1 hypothetical protein [Roseococcus sp. SDR]
MSSSAAKPTVPKAFEVINPDQLGRLIKQWVRGEIPIPKDDDLETFRQQIIDSGAGLKTEPRDFKRLRIITHRADELVLRLPPVEMVEEHENRLRGGDSYNVPGFYGTVTAPGAQQNASPQDKIHFDDARIGDYTIGNCA